MTAVAFEQLANELRQRCTKRSEVFSAIDQLLREQQLSNVFSGEFKMRLLETVSAELPE